MKRVAQIVTAFAGLLLILGLVEDLTNYKWSAGDQNTIFGNQNVVVNDGATVLIAGGFLAAVAALMWVLARRRDQGDQRRS